MDTNVLYWGDNLPILRNRDYFPDESVDLVYLDPPFNSNASYNVLFKEATGAPSTAQAEAFKDTWHWADAQDTWADLNNTAPKRVVDALEAFQKIIVLQEGRVAHNDMMAYLVMMTARLLELRRILKDTGSLYLHCDPTASHYLKIMLDTIFGATNFRNEIVWRRTASHNQPKRYGPIHDIILFYTKTNSYYFQPHFRPVTKGHVESYFKRKDARGYYWTNALTGAGTRNGASGQEWRGFNPTVRNRHWAVPGGLCADLGISEDLPLHDKLEQLYQRGFIDLPPDGSSAMPTFKQYLQDSPGIPNQDIWAYQPYTRGLLYGSEEAIDEDVRWLPRQMGASTTRERTGYQTQKPVGVLGRIINCSAPPDGVVLDPFCGCGTAVLAAHKLNRRWIGIDVTILAVNVMKQRLEEAFPDLKGKYRVVGEPTTLTEAQSMVPPDATLETRYQFQYWALGLVGARPASDSRKKGADAGVDGFFSVEHTNDGKKVTYIQVIVQVKSGHVGANLIRDLAGTVGNDKLGLFITLEEPTEPMKAAALAAGLYHNPLMNTHHPRIQIMTIEDLLDGKSPNLPPHRPGWARGSYIGQRIQQGTLIE